MRRPNLPIINTLRVSEAHRATTGEIPVLPKTVFIVIALRQLLLESLDSKMNGSGHYILDTSTNAFSNTGVIG